MKEVIDKLNKEQRQAVTSLEGPQLILAGAGSGKTRVLTSKIAYIIEEKKAYPSEILAFTFTNKAANEMKERLSQLSDIQVEKMWVGTFHSICVRILRMSDPLEGFNSNFSIYDNSDQKTLIRDIIRDFNLDEKTFSPNYVQARISTIKNQGLSPEDYHDQAYSYIEKTISSLYQNYQDRLKANNAFDFDDLIIKAIELLNINDKAREFYQNKFTYVFVDEYQDTNQAQYELIKILSGKYKNLTVVGDANQSIYKWRGADINNILNFEKDYKDVKRINLSQNYRSSQKILDSANHLIANNVSRFENNLWTENEKGQKPRLIELEDSTSEAKYVVSDIQSALNQEVASEEIAILYRSNSLSRAFEEELIKANIAYKVVGGIKFYDRAEIKDLLAYLNLTLNPGDDLALKRIINSPRRGIGVTSVNKLEELARENGTSLFEALDLVENSNNFDKRAKSNLGNFKKMLESFSFKAENADLPKVFDFIVNTTEYIKILENENTIEAKSKIENIEEFRSSIDLYMEDGLGNLSDFLAQISLLSDVDKTDNRPALSLMTVHGAKGLEFERVYIVGLEEGIFPSAYAELEEDIEEERRLMYVAITRAKKDLIMTYAKKRLLYGRYNHSKRSSFIDEIIDQVDFQKQSGLISFASNMQKSHYPKTYKSFKSLKDNNIDTRQLNSNKEYQLGQVVYHKKWGSGTIVKLVELEGDTQISVMFDDIGLKELMKSFAPLKVIE